ncbi:uncharacterized protein LY79DRAFT_575443 [Colletotrichum navitas]|uniref:Uncharacterized protein n=1 Tax=Colletotrichum navitas TaxID=681940 RepID=A0AAD8QA44_9PEZI|nr:uncharacterized protein LY79DRAFT_575443 [Colletotrichum navitas]KAK1598838.1 hypothetical protein LY79DRAFT_575443 [Colletotrichum navitas]
MSGTNQDVAARRGRDAQRRSRRCKMLQESRQAGNDSDDEGDDVDDESAIEYDGLEDCLEKKPVRIPEAKQWVDSEAKTAISEVSTSLNWEALAAEIYMARIRYNTTEDNSEKTVTGGSVVAAIRDTDINHAGSCNSFANAANPSQGHETDKNKIMGGKSSKSGNESSGGGYINAFKPINVRWVPPETGLHLFLAAINSLVI